MKKLIVNLAALSLIACGAEQLEEQEIQSQELDVGQLALKADANGKIPGYYIVKLKDDVDSEEFVRGHGLSANFHYRSAFKGFAGAIPEARLAQLQRDGRVEYIEADQAVYASAQTIPYGIANVGATTNSTLAGNGSGAVTGPS